MDSREHLKHVKAIEMKLSGQVKDVFKEWDKIKLWGLPYTPVKLNLN